MTTYLLSKKISLKSIYATNEIVRSFHISLDRDAETPDEMKEKVKDSFASFTELEQSDLADSGIVDYLEGSKCYTKFIYEYDAEGKKTAEIGIADLHKSIPFSLSFVEKINTIKEAEYGKVTTYTRLEPIQFNSVSIVRIEKQTESETTVIEIAKVSERHDALTIAVPVQHIEESKYRFSFPNEATPHQFISFPLVGSEIFPFPVVINSPLFNPDDTRSHVFLNLVDSIPFNKKVTLNRALFQKSIGLFKQLLSFSCSKNWENIHYLAKSDLPINVDEVWHKEYIQQEIRKEILYAEIVVTENGNKPIKPKDALFPVYGHNKLDEFWTLCKYIVGDKIPRKDDAPVWRDIIMSNTDGWLGADFDFGLEKLLLLIQNEGNFDAFSKKYFPSNAAPFDALNKIIRFGEDENKDLFDRKEKPLRVFPDQMPCSVFREKRELSRDVQIPFQLKDVLKTSGDNLYEKLIRDEILVFERDNKLRVKDVFDRINNT